MGHVICTRDNTFPREGLHSVTVLSDAATVPSDQRRPATPATPSDAQRRFPATSDAQRRPATPSDAQGRLRKLATVPSDQGSVLQCCKPLFQRLRRYGAAAFPTVLRRCGVPTALRRCGVPGPTALRRCRFLTALRRSGLGSALWHSARSTATGDHRWTTGGPPVRKFAIFQTVLLF